MFTGIVEEVGRLRSRQEHRYTFAVDDGTVTDGTRVGDSISVNGCCLTVVDVDSSSFAVDVVDETLSRTTLGLLVKGAPVNLERAMRLSDRLGGHLVAGHVDAVGEVIEGPPNLRVRSPSTLLMAEKGSIAVDGVSLTVVDLDDDSFSVAVIPHTLAATTLGGLEPGAAVNLEFDLIARHVARLMKSAQPEGT